MTKRNVMLRCIRVIVACAISTLVITSCKKADELVPQQPVEEDTESIISAKATPGYKAFSFTEIPFTNDDIVNPGRGAEQWHDRIDVNVPSETARTIPMDVYHRFVWTRLEGPTQGSYNWTYFDRLVNDAINKKQKMSFGIMTVYPDGTTDAGLAAYDGGYSCYPLYLHNLMKAEPVKDWRKGSTWVPNYNSNNYLNRLLALHQALYNHILATTYNGKRYRDVINIIDIRGYGSWGEWHSAGIVDNVSQYPAGTFPTVASLKRIVDAHTKGFPTFPLVAMIAAFDAGWLNNTKNPPEIAHYVLTQRNTWGPIGWRRDQWGATDNYIKDYLENNNRSYGGIVFKDLIMVRWRTAPITGEPPAWNPGDYYDLERQIRLYHATSFGNGNYGVVPNTTIKARVRASSKATGYRIKLLSGEAPPTITRNVAFGINTVWQNVGLAPSYENWTVSFELQTTTNVVKWVGNSIRVLKLFVPSASGTPTADRFTIPATVTPGTYKLVVRVRDPLAYRPNMRLAINGRNADGSYTLLSSVVVK